MFVLDIGCGRGAALIDNTVKFRRQLRILRGKCAKVIGLDVDPDARHNPGIDEFHLIKDGQSWPIPDLSIGLVLADFVLEHINDPGRFFSEVNRVLKPGGLFCARTSNRVGYVGLAASVVPNKRHAAVTRVVQKDRKSVDVFPTRGRVNTVWRLRRSLRDTGMDGIVYGYGAEPSYMQFSALAYGIGKFLHVITPSALRTSLFVFARKVS